ncbi:MAG: YqaJ viral recombinase family protein [Diaphorobacter nitroreducens]|uniref:YqaJ viral recombinase family protein n=1 Tax=Diaphorobacter nitroreducens TaxID=164759 RepID=UPI003C749D84
MQTHDLIQGSPEWQAYRRNHFNASDAPAMLGCSPYKQRDSLLREMATGIGEEVDEATQRRFDAGHRFEANARKLAEELLGEDLFPVVGSEGRYSASLDGLTMLGEICWEHKTLNAQLREAFADMLTCPPKHRERSGGKSLPLHYRAQLEQQLMVSGAGKCLFTASRWADDGTLLEAEHCWYYPDPELRARIVAGWEQFAADLTAYVPEAPKAAPVVAAPQETLPAVSVRVDGHLAIVSNLTAYGALLRNFIERIPTEPSTDQEFADTEAACKRLKRVEEELESAEDHALAQLADVNAMRQLVKEYRELARATRLQREKLVTLRKDLIRSEVVAYGQKALAAHISALTARLGKPYMPEVPADFAGAIKGKRTVDSLRDAVNTELARAKIAANEIADRIQRNLTTLRELASEHAFLFADTATIVLKTPDDLTVLVKSRIAEHTAKEAARLEAERERIAAEERRKAEAAAEAERTRIRAEEQAKAQAEARVEQERQRQADREAREEAIQAERDAQAGIAEARAADTLPAPLLDDLSSLASDLKNDVVSSIDARQAISAAQRSASVAQPESSGTANLLIGAINAQLGYVVNAAFLAQLGFHPVRADGARRFYRDSDLPLIGRAIAQHTLHVTQPQEA